MMRLVNVFACIWPINKRIALGSLLAIVGVSGCGGGAEDPVVDVPQQWSTAQLSKTSFSDSVPVSGHADLCGGISAIGFVANGWVAQRFSPTQGWQPARPIAQGLDGSSTSIQRIDVAGVPTVFYRDSRNWYRDHFDCADNVWRTVTAFPVEYVAPLTSGGPATPNSVSFTETHAHNVLATWVTSSGDAVVLAELRGEVWTVNTPVAAFAYESHGSTVLKRAVGLWSVSVVRAKEADVALITYSLGTRYVAIRTTSTVDFLPLSYGRGCLGHFCVGYPEYRPPQLELDGSASVLLSPYFGTGTQDWYRAGIGGLQSLWGSTAPYALAYPLPGVVRADGVAQWLTWNAPTAEQPMTINGDIFEGGAPSAWANPYALERSACFGGACRAFSSPDTTHLVTVMNAGVTPSRVPYLAISDRMSAKSWAGSYSTSLGQLWVDGPNANGSGSAGSGNGTVALVKFHATDRLQAVLAVLDSTRRDGSGTRNLTPFVIWK